MTETVELPDEAEIPDVEEAPLREFDERWKQPFEGLLYLGALQKTFEIWGHSFSIRTLRTDEYLIVPLLIKDWEGTIGFERAYATAIVALATELVDGAPLPLPFEEVPGKPLLWAQGRFDHVKGRWFDPVVDAVYSEYLALENDVRRTLEALGESSAPTA